MTPMKVYGGFHHGRILNIPGASVQGDIVPLPVDLPEGARWSRGRTVPSAHTNETIYVVRRSSEGFYLSTPVRPIRLVKSVEIPPAAAEPITINL